MIRYSLLAAAAAVALAGLARADEGVPPESKDQASVGVGLICDTPEEAQQYVALRAQGAELQPAVGKVNAAANNPRACGLAAIAYVPVKMVASRPAGSKLLQVFEVHVVAGYNGSGWQPVTNMTQYAVIEAKGELI
jgi:hypothetical protein